VIDGFFFHGIQVHGDRLGIDEGFNPAAVIYAHPAAAARALREEALKGAQLALHPVADGNGEPAVPDPGVIWRYKPRECGRRRIEGQDRGGAKTQNRHADGYTKR